MKKLLFCFFNICSIQRSETHYILKVYDVLLTSDDIQELQTIYKQYIKKNLTKEHILCLLYIYHYLMIYVNSGQSMDMTNEELPDELKNHHLVFVLKVLWNEEQMMNIYNSIVNIQENNNDTHDESNKKYWQYTLIVGNYKGAAPTLKEVDGMFKSTAYSNFLPDNKYGKYYNLKLSTTESEFDLRSRLIVDKTTKKFSYILLKAPLYSNIKYDVILFIFEEVYGASEGFQILQDNKNMKPDEVVDLFKHYNLPCKKSTSSLNSSQLDGAIGQILENAVIGQYIIIPNSQYIVYITKKTRCATVVQTDEDKLKAQGKLNLEKLLSYVAVDGNSVNWQELERIFYDSK